MEKKTNKAKLEIFSRNCAWKFNKYTLTRKFRKIFTETLEQIVTKSHKILFLDGKEDYNL